MLKVNGKLNLVIIYVHKLCYVALIYRERERELHGLVKSGIELHHVDPVCWYLQSFLYYTLVWVAFIVNYHKPVPGAIK